jgi:HAD superfamily 5'-nucleotidase-like hydrolase
VTHSRASSHGNTAESHGFLYDLGQDLKIPPEKRVYVNRNLRLGGIKAVGFDLDHTLAHYDPHPVGRLAYHATLAKLIENLGYPEDTAEIPFEPDSAVRGLVIDLERGNLLKMDRHDYVQRAYHGKKILPAEERKQIYSSKRFSFSGSNYASVDTLFHLPEVSLFAALIDYYERKGRSCDFKQLFRDIRSMIDLAHRDGTIKNRIVSEPDRFLRVEPSLVDTLERLVASGKLLFLLTNSEPEYADALMRHIFAAAGAKGSWKDYFRLVVTRANKPFFFSRRKSRKPSAEMDGSTVACANAYDLERLLRCKADKIMYFGDHTYGDILKAKKVMGWRTGMIVPELASEIEAALKIKRAYNRLVDLSMQRKKAEKERAEIEEMSSRNPGFEPSESIDQLDRTINCLSDEIDTLETECQFAYNPHWGSIFREGKEISRFGHQVKDFACIYMYNVSCILNYPADHYFQTNVDFMPHEFFL